SRPCQSVASPAWVEPAATHHAGDAARRGGHQALARGALAGPAKKASEEGATIIWVDESAFYLLPHIVRTWAPRGQTPRLAVKHTKDHLWAISARGGSERVGG